MSQFVITAAVLGIVLCIGITGYTLRDIGTAAEFTDFSDIPVKYSQRLTALERQALDEAYKAQINRLFSTWMRDETGQPARAIQGARRARQAYEAVADQLEKRERAAQPAGGP